MKKDRVARCTVLYSKFVIEISFITAYLSKIYRITRTFFPKPDYKLDPVRNVGLSKLSEFKLPIIAWLFKKRFWKRKCGTKHLGSTENCEKCRRKRKYGWIRHNKKNNRWMGRNKSKSEWGMSDSWPPKGRIGGVPAQRGSPPWHAEPVSLRGGIVAIWVQLRP